MNKGHLHHENIIETGETPIRDIRIRSGIMMGVGLGDAFADVAHVMGADKIAGLYTKVTGNDCGCADRQKNWNDLWPHFR